MVTIISQIRNCFSMLTLALLLTFVSTLTAAANEDSYGAIFINDFYIASESEEHVAPVETAKAVLLPSSIPYEVRPGDTFYRIARSFGVSIQQLLAANTALDPNRLAIGLQLNVPVQEPVLQAASGESAVIKQVLSSTLTAYTAGYESTGKTPGHPQYGITYSGSKVQAGRTIAVDPDIIPIGSKVFIDGIGFRTAEDTGSAIRGSRIDVYIPDLQEARDFGVKKNVKVYVLTDKAVGSGFTG
ncbi:3D domain-containing protein [Paenibacillus sp. YYML68]|uniref:3D domain-containing protein n=1 Tax=Paenibacillus sp. YYML68 TaxID=2909250 RepID=UPI0024920569|nr:3D domain-containing protein [Paenibacillus sp. YYML68]